MAKLSTRLKEKNLQAKQEQPQTNKNKTDEEVVAGNTKVAKAITDYHSAIKEEASAQAKKKEAVKEISDYGLNRMWEKQKIGALTLVGQEDERVYVVLKDQYNTKVDSKTERCDELEQFLGDHGLNPEEYVSYEEKASLNVNKMTDEELDRLVGFLEEAFGQERMDEIFALKTQPKISGLVEMMAGICHNREEFDQLRSISQQHKPTVNVPSTPASGGSKKKKSSSKKAGKKKASKKKTQ